MIQKKKQKTTQLMTCSHTEFSRQYPGQSIITGKTEHKKGGYGLKGGSQYVSSVLQINIKTGIKLKNLIFH